MQEVYIKYLKTESGKPVCTSRNFVPRARCLAQQQWTSEKPVQRRRRNKTKAMIRLTQRRMKEQRSTVQGEKKYEELVERFNLFYCIRLRLSLVPLLSLTTYRPCSLFSASVRACAGVFQCCLTLCLVLKNFVIVSSHCPHHPLHPVYLFACCLFALLRS